MTNAEENRCHAIIHSHAAACAAGNAVPVPGLGLAADLVAMTTMCMSLAAVFGKDLPESVAKGMAVTTLKRTLLKRPVKMVAKELSKLIPGLGQVVAPAISAATIEATGWTLAKQLSEGKLLADR